MRDFPQPNFTIEICGPDRPDCDEGDVLIIPVSGDEIFKLHYTVEIRGDGQLTDQGEVWMQTRSPDLHFLSQDGTHIPFSNCQAADLRDCTLLQGPSASPVRTEGVYNELRVLTLEMDTLAWSGTLDLTSFDDSTYGQTFSYKGVVVNENGVNKMRFLIPIGFEKMGYVLTLNNPSGGALIDRGLFQVPNPKSVEPIRQTIVDNLPTACNNLIGDKTSGGCSDTSNYTYTLLLSYLPPCPRQAAPNDHKCSIPDNPSSIPFALDVVEIPISAGGTLNPGDLDTLTSYLNTILHDYDSFDYWDYGIKASVRVRRLSTGGNIYNGPSTCTPSTCGSASKQAILLDSRPNLTTSPGIDTQQQAESFLSDIMNTFSPIVSEDRDYKYLKAASEQVKEDVAPPAQSPEVKIRIAVKQLNEYQGYYYYSESFFWAKLDSEGRPVLEDDSEQNQRNALLQLLREEGSAQYPLYISVALVVTEYSSIISQLSDSKYWMTY